MPHQYVCVYRWFESDCQRVQKSLLLTSHIGLSAASHKLRCKASESNCQVVCLLVSGGGLSVQCRTRAGPWHTPSKQKSKLVCMLISTFKLFDEHFCVLHGWLIGKSCVEYSKDSCSPTHPNPTHHTSHITHKHVHPTWYIQRRDLQPSINTRLFPSSGEWYTE